MTPIESYQHMVQSGSISKDAEQLQAMQQLQMVFQNIIKENINRSGLLAFLHKAVLVKGLYLWGGVGIGKTLMMDCFYDALPFQNKLRMHFHQFMQLVHNKLTELQGQADPLQIIANDLANKAFIICFDEFFVSDITDAMLLGRLFKTLFKRGVCLIATSNSAPDDLYKNGLQRSQFLPAIAALKENLTIWHLPTSVDYRLRHLKEAGVFYTPLNEISQQKMDKTFTTLAQGQSVDEAPILIFDRTIPVKKKTNDTVWFAFKDICSVPRSQKDYLIISEIYKTVMISDIPIIETSDQICLFISLVDVFYDAKVRLVISAAEPISDIYRRGHMLRAFARTNSRLQEMQSVDYFTGEFGSAR